MANAIVQLDAQGKWKRAARGAANIQNTKTIRRGTGSVQGVLERLKGCRLLAHSAEGRGKAEGGMNDERRSPQCR
jgi:hypothetical protein